MQSCYYCLGIKDSSVDRRFCNFIYSVIDDCDYYCIKYSYIVKDLEVGSAEIL